jgi:hypothetical protein
MRILLVTSIVTFCFIKNLICNDLSIDFGSFMNKRVILNEEKYEINYGCFANGDKKPMVIILKEEVNKVQLYYPIDGNQIPYLVLKDDATDGIIAVVKSPILMLVKNNVPYVLKSSWQETDISPEVLENLINGLFNSLEHGSSDK